MNVINIYQTADGQGCPDPVLQAVLELKELIMSEAANIRREIGELRDAQLAVVALVNTNADALAATKTQLAAALEKIALDEAQLAEFNGIATDLDGIEQSLRAVLPVPPVEPEPEPETPVDPETPTDPVTPTDPETPTDPVDPQTPPAEEPTTPVDEQPAPPVDAEVPVDGEVPAEGTDPNATKPAV